MDLIVAAQKIEADLKKREQSLDEREARLSAIEVDLVAREKKAIEIYDELKAKSDDLSVREAKVRREDELLVLEKELQEKVSKLARDMGELTAYENKLAIIHRDQTAKENSLAERERKLSEDKETYKETLKAEFLETLKRQMPQ